MSETWIGLCPLAELADGEARRFDTAGLRVAVARIADDVYAIGDRCSHEDYSLAEGEVDTDDCTLECAKHGSLFSLLTGDALTLPAVRPVPVYEVRIQDGQVQLGVPSDE